MKRPPTPLERLVSENLTKLMASREDLSTEKAIAKATINYPVMVSQTTVGRIKKCHHSAQLDSIEAIANAYGIPAWHLLLPKLDVKNPPIVLTGHDKRFYNQFREISNEFMEAAEDDSRAASAPNDGLPNSTGKSQQPGSIRTRTKNAPGKAQTKTISARRGNRKAVTAKASK